jgi:hypothetical protein
VLDLAHDALSAAPDALAKLYRMVLVQLAFPLPAARRRAFERRLRGREQLAKLRRADAAVVSYGKAGRTWLRVMLSGYYQHRYGLSARSLLAFDNFHRRDARIPRLFFTHDNYLADYTGHRRSKQDFYDKKVVLLVRSPQDTVVSQFFQWKYRMREAKKRLNDYPADADISIFEFAMGAGAGLPRIIDFMNLWAEEAPRVGQLLLVRYEDLRSDPEAGLRGIVRFLDGAEDPDSLRHAVAFASVDNMRGMETRRTFWLAGSRMAPRDRGNPDSFKVRRAVVGGYRDYFDDEQIARIDELVRLKLAPIYGYGAPPPAPSAS